MSILIAFFVAVYIVGIAIAYSVMNDWGQPKWQKCVWAVFWPLVAILYGIHWIHNKK